MRIIFFLLISITCFAQKDIVIKPTDWSIDGVKWGIKPGDRIILQGPLRGAIEFHNLTGVKDNPVTITAVDKVLIKRSTDGGRVVQFSNCDYIRFTGTEQNLIEITGGGHGVTISNMSNHPEVDHLYIHHVGYSGIDITNYPTCDPKTWRGAYIMADVLVHDNLITDLTDGEGVYIGPSHYQKSFPLQNCSSGVTSALEHDVVNVQVYRNTIRNVGADGIQVGGATGGGSIYWNKIEKFGTKGVYGQSSGIQANPGSKLVIENNTVEWGSNFGIILQGRSGTVVRRNRVSNTAGGIMIVARETLDKGIFYVHDNTWTDITGNGVEYYSNVDFSNNILQVKPGYTLLKRYAGTLTEILRNIKIIGTSADLKLDTNYVPTPESPAYVTDFTSRDIGAYTSIKIKPPVITKETATAELITTDGVEEWWLITPSGKRIKLQ
jgi:parallel beta-helix repeat protein